MKFVSRPALAVVVAVLARSSAAQQTSLPTTAAMTFQEVMIPVRDGVHLQTVILRPANQTGPLPILFTRTPYGVPDRAIGVIPASWKELMQDGYIVVLQNLRGRFKSEGTFGLTSRVDLADPKATNETTDAYDSIDWLVKNVANNNGKVGMFGSAQLDHDLTITGPVAAYLFVSTSGTDADFIVKLIDEYPESAEKTPWNPDAGPAPGAFAGTTNGYELPVAMEVRRGRYLKSYEQPTPLEPNIPIEWDIPLRDHDHVFLKGHRIMVQVQSTWFPVIDGNPQKFVPSIYQATASDYEKATQRIYCGSMPASRIELSVVQ